MHACPFYGSNSFVFVVVDTNGSVKVRLVYFGVLYIDQKSKRN